MERADKFAADAELTEPSPAAIRLAAAIAKRVDAVVPRPFRMYADADVVSLYDREEWRLSVSVGGLLDQHVEPRARPGERYSFAWYAAAFAEGVLSSVQDVVSTTTTEMWPLLREGSMARSGARTDGEHVYLWYGPDHEREIDAAVSFAPISLADLRTGK